MVPVSDMACMQGYVRQRDYSKLMVTEMTGVGA